MSKQGRNGSGTGARKLVNEAAVECAANRFREVRQAQGVSLRTLVRQIGARVDQNLDPVLLKEWLVKVDNQEVDLKLSELYLLAQILGVPAEELFVEPDGIGLSGVVKIRATFVQLMKTARSINEAKTVDQVRRHANNFMEMLIRLVPELSTLRPKARNAPDASLNITWYNAEEDVDVPEDDFPG